jgi:hypothetical protein
MLELVAVGWEERPEAEDAVALGELLARRGGAALVRGDVPPRDRGHVPKLDRTAGGVLGGRPQDGYVLCPGR